MYLYVNQIRTERRMAPRLRNPVSYGDLGLTILSY